MYKKIEIKQIELDRKSPLYFAEHFDMNTKRFFYVLDMKKGEVRGAHAHKKTSQLIWVISGAMEIQALDDKGDILYQRNLINILKQFYLTYMYG